MNTCANTQWNADSSYEQLVNARTAERRKNHAIWHRKTLRLIVALLAAFTVFLALWIFRVIPGITAVYAMEALSCAISFMVGRIYEKACQ